MGQYWYLLNVDKRQNAHDVGEKLTAEYFVIPGAWGYGLLINSLRKQYLPEAYEDLLTQGRPAARQNGLLGKLAVELLSMIYDQLSSTDALCLAVTCKSLLAASKQRLTETLSDRHLFWGGDRLILLGEYTCGRVELPTSLLTDAEWDEVVQASLSEDLKPKMREAGLMDGQVSMPVFATNTYKGGPLYGFTKREKERLRSIIFRLRADWDERMYGSFMRARRSTNGGKHDPPARPSWDVNMNDSENIRALSAVRYDTKGGVEVVCNLSKGEYIRADGFTLPLCVDLGQALLACITWSSSNDVTMDIEDDFLDVLVQGSWACDRFIATTINALPALGPDIGEWRDVTEGVNRLLSTWVALLVQYSAACALRGGSRHTYRSIATTCIFYAATNCVYLRSSTFFRYNVDREETGGGLPGGPLGYFFFFKRNLDHVLGCYRGLLNSLRPPCMPEPQIRENTHWLSEGKTIVQRRALLKLPPEVLDQILEELQGHDIKFMLEIACKFPLCNCRLILLGQNTRGRAALPRGLLTDAEWDIIGAVREGGLAAFAKQKYIPALGERDTLHHLRRTSSRKLHDEMCNAPWAMRKTRRLNHYRMFCVLWGCAGVAYSAGPLVLCNLSKGEYVREGKLISQWHLGVTLAHALLACIAWSLDASGSMKCLDEFLHEFTHGLWASDRFEVSTVETLPTSTYGNRQ
ncbi:hypothetical protein C8Q79DRAFT_1101776 [Trametes meyenii]|nr:hypothetical protein C8Q79DRAFT_1101776 [Trametes meyenii]